MRNPAFCICENKDADQLRSNCAADQRLCFRYTDSAIPLLAKSEISSLSLSYVIAQPGLCRTWSDTPKTGFLTTRLNNEHIMLTCSYNLAPPPPYTPLLYCKTGVYRGIYYFLIFALKHRLWVPVRSASMMRF